MKGRQVRDFFARAAHEIDAEKEAPPRKALPSTSTSGTRPLGATSTLDWAPPLKKIIKMEEVGLRDHATEGGEDTQSPSRPAGTASPIMGGMIR